MFLIVPPRASWEYCKLQLHSFMGFYFDMSQWFGQERRWSRRYELQLRSSIQMKTSTWSSLFEIKNVQYIWENLEKRSTSVLCRVCGCFNRLCCFMFKKYLTDGPALNNWEPHGFLFFCRVTVSLGLLIQRSKGTRSSVHFIAPLDFVSNCLRKILLMD